MPVRCTWSAAARRSVAWYASESRAARWSRSSKGSPRETRWSSRAPNSCAMEPRSGSLRRSARRRLQTSDKTPDEKADRKPGRKPQRTDAPGPGQSSHEPGAPRVQGDRELGDQSSDRDDHVDGDVVDSRRHLRGTTPGGSAAADFVSNRAGERLESRGRTGG